MKFNYLILLLSLFLSPLNNTVQAQPCSCTNCPVPITDNGTFQGFLDVTVNGANNLGQCPLQRVCFTIKHTWISDLAATLTSPSGLNYIVMGDWDNTFHDSNNNDNIEICVDVGTSNPITNNTQYPCNSGSCSLGTCCLNGNWTMPCGGVTDPITNAVQAPNCDLNDFNISGHPANGIWTLTVNDVCAQDVGFLEDWSLDFACGIQSCMGACQNPPVVNATSNSPVCEGDDIMLGELGGQAVDWQWSGPNSFTSSIQNPSILNATAINAGQYNVTITDTYGCTNTDSVDVIVSPPLQIDNLFDTTICEWDAVPLMPNITGGSGSYSCMWMPPLNLNDPFSCTPVFRSSATGVYTYTLTVTDNINGCTATKIINITNENCCTPTMTGCSACTSQCTMMGTELVVNGDFSGGDTGFSSNLNSNCSCIGNSYCIATSAVDKCTNSLWQHIKAPNCTGNYMVVDGRNGIIWSQFVTVQPNEEYNFSFDFYPDISGGGSPTLELWVDGAPAMTGIVGTLGTWASYCTSWTYTGSTPISTPIEIRQVVQAQYSDYGIDNISFSKCESSLMVDAIPDTTVCENETVQLDAIVTGNSGSYDCTWSPTTDLSDPNICNPIFTPTAPGTYTFTVEVIDSDSCSQTDEITIIVNPQPSVYATSNSPICEGETLTLCELGGQAVSWQWTGPNSFTSTLMCPKITNADPSINGTYTVTITDANGCTNTASVNVTVYPALMLSHPTSIVTCEWNSAPLSPTITGGSGSYSCSWSPSGNLDDPNSCTPNFFASTMGLHTLTMTVIDNVTGCSDAINISIEVIQCCTPTTTSCNSCPFDCFTMGSDLVVNGDFSGGDTGFSSGLSSNCTCTAGSYCVATNARNKCTNGLWQPIYAPDCMGDYMVVDGAIGSIWSQTVTPVAGGTYNFGFDFYPTISGGTSPVLELWVDGSPIGSPITEPLAQWSRHCASWTAPAPAAPVTIEIRQIASGTYSDYGIDNIEFTECIPPPSISLASDTTICEGDIINLTTLISGGVAPYTCQWTPTAGISPSNDCNPTFKKDQAGVYPVQVVVTDDAGCIDSATIIITVERCCTPQALSCNACMSCTTLGTELVTNGDFSQGNTGFTTGLNPTENCTCASNSYCVGDNARDKCTNGLWQFIQAPDCDSFMIVDGGGNADIWIQTGIPVTMGQTYNFSFALYPDISGSGGPTMEMRVDGTSILGGITGTAGMWESYCATYTATATGTVDLSLAQVSGSGFNDFGLDLISFRPCGAIPDIALLTDTTICEMDDLLLNPIITGGSGSYTCSWSPSANLNNANICAPTFSSNTAGVFTYTLTVTDDVSMCTNTATINITVEECCTPVSTYCNACTTMCSGPGPELVINGDFALGNTGFTSGLPLNCSCASSSYCVGNNARDKCTNGLWQPIKAPDCDSFMIVDGGANTDIWIQSGIPVTAGLTYNFSFSLYPDISGSGGPVIDMKVDGTPVLSGITGTAGSWTGHCVAYTATTTGTVTLAIAQTSGSGFNDFGIDQISFSQCEISQIVVTIPPVSDFCESVSAILNTNITVGSGTPTCQWSPTTGLSSSTDCNPTVSGLSAGSHTYSVTVTDPSNCTATASVSFDVNEDPTVNGILFNQVCEGDDLNLGVSATPTPTSYQWAGPGFSSTSSNPTITGVTQANAGVYSVTVTTADGCTGTASQNIPVNVNNGLIFLSYNAPVCHLGTLNLEVSGAPMSSYSWTGPGGFISNLQNPSIPNPTQANNGGTYDLTVTDANGCTRVWSINVTIEDAPSILALSNTPICEGDPLQVYEVGGDAVSWNWSGPNGFGSTSQVETIASATTGMSGNYFVTITDADGCTTSAVAIVSVLSSPTISNLPDTTICVYDFYQFNPTITGGSGNYSCSWTSPANLNNASICTPTFQATTPGFYTYTLTVTDISTGCTSTESVTISVDDCCSLITTNCSSCSSGCQGSELVVDGDFNSLAGNAPVGSALPAVLGCSVGSYWITDNARAKCNHPLWNNVPAPDCGNYMVVDGANGRIWSQSVNVVAGSTYNFGFDFFPNVSGGTSPGMEIRIDAITIATNITAPSGTWTGICEPWTATFTGSAFLEIWQSSNGTYSDYGIDNVTFTECLLGPKVAIGFIPTICENDCVTMNTSITNTSGSHTCSWSPSANLNDPNLCSPTVCGLSPGVHTYVVTVTDSLGCVGIDSIDISVKAQPSAVAVSNSPVCEGDDIQLNETGGSATSWSWTGPNSFSSNLQSPIITSSVWGVHDGTYTVTTQNAAGCSNTASVVVDVETPIAIGGLIDSTVCEGDPILLNPVISGGSGSYSCSWSPALHLNNASSCTPTFNANNASVTTYTLTVTDNATGCTGTETVTLTAETCCTPVQTGCAACASFCGSNELVVNGDFSAGDTGFSSGLSSGCSCFSGYCIGDNARDKCTNGLWQPIRSPDCVGNFMIIDGWMTNVWTQNVTVTAGNTYFFGFDFYPNVSDGASPGLEMLIDGQPILSNITAPLDMWTSHCVSWTATTSGTIPIAIDQIFTAFRSDYGIDNISFRECYDLEITADADTVICDDATLALSAMSKGGTGTVSCQWIPGTGLSDPNDCNPTFTPPGVGTYTFIVVGLDMAGCFDTDTIEIEVENCCQVIVDAGMDTTICEMDIALLDAIATGGTGPYTCSWSPTTGLSDPNICNPTVSGLPLGVHEYFVTVTDASGCTAIDSVEITVGNCCLVLTGPTSDPFNLNNMNNGTLRGLDFWDVNADGIEDLVYASNINGPMMVHLNTGSATSPNFSATSTSMGINAYAHYNIDYNQDGFMDFFAWINDQLHYYENLGTVNGGTGFYNYAVPVYVGIDIPPSTTNWFAYPAVGDLNNDGMPDVIVATQEFLSDGNTHYYENTAANVNVPPTFSHIGNPWFNLGPPNNSSSVQTPEIFDGDCDGDLDLFVGRADEVLYFENNGTVTSGINPDFNTTPIINPFGINGLTHLTEHSHPRFVEIDDDNNVELFVNDFETSGQRFQFFENICGCPSGVNQFRCAQNVLNLGGPILPGLYHAIEEINSGDATVAAGMTVDYKAGNGILLESSFDVVLGAQFSAEIEMCNTPFAPDPTEEAVLFQGASWQVESNTESALQLQIQLPMSEKVEIRLFDINGQAQPISIKTKQVGDLQLIDIEQFGLSSGVYFLSVETEDGEWRERIVVQRE